MKEKIACVLLVCLVTVWIALACNTIALSSESGLHVLGDPIDDPKPHCMGDPIDDPKPHCMGDPIDDPTPHSC